MAIIVDGHGPLKALPVSPATAFDALLCAVSDDVSSASLSLLRVASMLPCAGQNMIAS
jgi:hypothetical protein